MNENDQELMQRYIYQVVRRMPKEQAEEIRMELEELITDLMESKSLTMEHTLEQLGDPKEFAKKYQNQNRCLISSEYIDTYCFILKIVVICFGAIALLSSITTYNYSDFNLVDYIVELIVSSLSNMLTGFGNVTLIFVIIEYFTNKNKASDSTTPLHNFNSLNSQIEQTTWKPNDLAPIPDKKSVINRGDSLISIIIFTLLCAIFIYQPEMIGMYVFKDHEFTRSIPIFQISEWSRICPYFIVIFFLGLVDEIVKLATGCYCKLVMTVNILCNVLQVILAAILLKVAPIWNPSFQSEVSDAFGRTISSKGDILYYWGTDTISNIVLAIIVALSVIEISYTTYKTIRYANQ